MKLLVLILSCAVSVAAAAAPNSNPKLRFVDAGTNGFTFDTGLLRGKLRAGGKSTGLSSVIHIPTGTRLDRSMGLFSHYRLFTTAHRYGTAAWDAQSDAALAADGSVEVRWPAAPERPFELRAVYRWAAPDTLDLETSVSARSDLPKFESFLASYFSEGFTNAAIFVNSNGQRWFMRLEQTNGTWQAFPRDAAAAAIIRDGRWKIEPNPVDWVLMPTLAEPLGVRRCVAKEVRGVLMSRPSDCFAILAPFETEPHYSMYLCLFGRDLKAGETARARTRLWITQCGGEDLTNAYEAFAKPIH